MEERRHLSELGSSVVGVAGDTKALFGSDSRWSRNPDELEKHRGQTVRDLRASDRSNRDGHRWRTLSAPTSASMPNTASRRASSRTSPSIRILRKSKRMKSKSTSRASACSSPKSASSFSRDKESSPSAARPEGASSGARTAIQPVMFFSRRIGLAGGEQTPIRAGGRLTGRAGRYTIGLLPARMTSGSFT